MAGDKVRAAAAGAAAAATAVAAACLAGHSRRQQQQCQHWHILHTTAEQLQQIKHQQPRNAQLLHSQPQALHCAAYRRTLTKDVEY
jgi:hypothetical protein